MRLHANLVIAAAQTLHAIFIDGKKADKAIETILKSSPKWGARDRGFVAENVYEAVRHYRHLSAGLGYAPQSVSDWAALIGVRLLGEGVELPDWDFFEKIDRSKLSERLADCAAELACRESVPDWLDAVGRAELAEEWAPTLAALNRPASLIVRANTLKTTRTELIGQLTAEGYAVRPLGETGEAIEFAERPNLFGTRFFKEGLLEVQDFSSQLVAPLLDPRPGERVVDACAGAGGKTLHLAALMGNKGRIIALDTEAWKLDELRRRSRRAGCDIVEARPIQDRKTIKRLYGTADRLLIDAPCSGLGVLRRNPDTKWKLRPEFLDHIRKVQREILSDYARILRPGGTMVYATCSILPSENQAQVQLFLKENPKFALLSEHVVSPQDGYDGFFMAKLILADPT